VFAHRDCGHCTLEFSRGAEPFRRLLCQATHHDPVAVGLGTRSDVQASRLRDDLAAWRMVGEAPVVVDRIPRWGYYRVPAMKDGPQSDIFTLSNFRGRGPAKVGANRGVAPYGTYDMAGNVKEWTVNPTADRYYQLGGAWNRQSRPQSWVRSQRPAR
jgi:sulfatase-modifying factor enzyme 1